MIKVNPRASRQRITVDGDLIRMSVTAPPVDGGANQAVVEAIADALHVAKSRVDILRGHTSRTKLMRIRDMELSEAMLRLTKSAI